MIKIVTRVAHRTGLKRHEYGNAQFLAPCHSQFLLNIVINARLVGHILLVFNIIGRQVQDKIN